MSEESTAMVPQEPPTELTLYQEPDQVLSEAHIAAKALKGVIDKKAKPVKFNNETYLEFEDWQTVGRFYGVTVRTYDAMPVELDGVKGFKARAQAVKHKTGIVISSAESFCMRDEPNWKNKPSFQLASMAQTRAGAKALRNCLSWVVVLAGYKPTPAEEIMDGFSRVLPSAPDAPGSEEKPPLEDSPIPVKTPASQGESKAHWCDQHGCAFVHHEKGGKEWWSHKTEKGWCNEGKLIKEFPEEEVEEREDGEPEFEWIMGAERRKKILALVPLKSGKPIEKYVLDRKRGGVLPLESLPPAEADILIGNLEKLPDKVTQ